MASLPLKTRFSDEDEALALESMRNLSRFPEHSRWMVFEAISRFSPNEREKVIARMDATPFDFAQERELLRNKLSRDLPASLP